MRKFFKRMTTAIALMTVTATLLACGDNAERAVEVTETEAEVIVTFMRGDTELGSIAVAAGETVTGYEAYESVDGYDFNGWYDAPTFVAASAKDLTVDTFTEDKVLYGDFIAAEAAEDTREWFIVGEGSDMLASSQWAGGVDDAVKESLKLQPTGNKNEFQITINLYEGDLFQVIHDWAWDGQKGFGTITEYDAATLESGGGLGGSEATANAKVLQDGNYTITLTTDPDNSAHDTYIVVRNGDAE